MTIVGSDLDEVCADTLVVVDSHVGFEAMSKRRATIVVYGHGWNALPTRTLCRFFCGHSPRIDLLA